MPPRRPTPLLAVAGLFAALLLLGLPVITGRWPECPFHRLTGLYCAGCGGTRAIRALFHGDVATCFRMNLLLPLLLAAAVLFCFRPRLLRSPAVPVALTAAILLFAVLRNLPGFRFLAPY